MYCGILNEREVFILLNEKVFYTDSRYNFFIGIVKEINDTDYLVYSKENGQWVSKNVEFYNVHRLSLDNINIFETKRFLYVKQQTKKIKSNINEFNQKIIELSNKICMLEQEKKTGDNYKINKMISELLHEKKESQKKLEVLTINYIETMQDIVFLKRINRIKDSLSER